MSSTSAINKIKLWLNSRHINVSLNWVEDCVEFIRNEYQLQEESIQTLKNCVWEQWLTADLGEIGVCCLPANLSVIQKTTLQGCYALQVNGICDIGKSAYSQLKQLDVVSHENSEVSATPKEFVPEWEAKPTRMLMMNLTDGINYVQAMEYKPISFLSDAIPVGTKVIIQGPVDCRFGVVLLTGEKIQVLGGEVEALKEKYSKQAILQEALRQKNGNTNSAAESSHSENQYSARIENRSVHSMQSSSAQHQALEQTSGAIPGRSSVAPSHPTNIQIREINANPEFEGLNYTENLDFDSFEDADDDAFIKSIDYNALEQIEKSSSLSRLSATDDFDESEDEEIYREVMAYQKNAEFDVNKYVGASCKKSPSIDNTTSSCRSLSSSVRYPKPSTSAANQKPSFTPPSFSSVKPKSLISTVSLPTSNQSSAPKATSSISDLVLPSSSTFPSPNQQASSLSPAADRVPSSISSVLQNLDSSEFTVTIKAHISATVSRLECSSSLGWQLTAKLSDGTGTIEAIIHDKVLEKFVGISAKDMIALQVQARTNVEVRNQVLEAIGKCKKKLQCLNCLMEVQFSPQFSKPCVIKCFSSCEKT